MPTTQSTVQKENYTKEQAATIRTRYLAAGRDVTESAHEKRAEVVKQLAKEIRGGDSVNEVRSVRSKIVSMKDDDGKSIYIARSKTSAVTKGDPVKKDELAKRLVAASGLNLNVDSLAKANKTDIVTLLEFFNSQVVDESETEAETEAEA